MTLTPTSLQRLARARTDLRTGLPVCVRAGHGHALVLAAEQMSDGLLDELRGADVDVELAVTDWRAATLKARAYDGDLARITVPATASVGWIRAVADPSVDLRTPLKGPFQTLRGGDASVHRAAIALVKSARLLPCAVVVHWGGPPDDLTTLDLRDIEGLVGRNTPFFDVVSARLPLETAPTTRLHVFRPDDGGEEHYAVEVGLPDRAAPILVRLHSACFTGDVLGSLKCDCGPQLKGALEQMGSEGSGILLYLNQEGRGIGLANKMRAYALQDQGFDTVDANHRLGFEDDERDFRVGAGILEKLGISQVRLMTNNPRKVDMLESCGIKVVERVPLRVGENPLNSRYLDTKAKKSGHIL
ncbi:MAG: GTP cyclohydrolase II [Pseudomonadota bacterium]